MNIRQMMIDSYIEAMQWASTDYEGEPLDNYELSDDAVENAEKACDAFILAHSDVLDIVMKLHPDYSYSLAGHDLFLTREHHGSGFWDRGLGEYGDVFTKYCHCIGGADPFVGDDQLIYMGE